jgi:hypothetical protein
MKGASDHGHAAMGDGGGPNVGGIQASAGDWGAGQGPRPLPPSWSPDVALVAFVTEAAQVELRH